MGFYHFIIGIGTIFLIGILWALLAYSFDKVGDTFQNITPTQINGYPVNQTAVRAEIGYAQDVVYYFIFFIVIVIIGWIVRKSVAERDMSKLWGG